jgi:putative ABC transport system permease protein
VAVQVRCVDYVAVAATIALGVTAVADVLFLNIRERAAELATIRPAGLASVLVTVVAALVPAQLPRRLPTAQLLAEE